MSHITPQGVILCKRFIVIFESIRRLTRYPRTGIITWQGQRGSLARSRYSGPDQARMICYLSWTLLSLKLERLSALHSLGESIQTRNLGEEKGQASLKWSKIIVQIPIELFTRSNSGARSMCFMRSKRNRLAG